MNLTTNQLIALQAVKESETSGICGANPFAINQLVRLGLVEMIRLDEDGCFNRAFEYPALTKQGIAFLMEVVKGDP